MVETAKEVGFIDQNVLVTTVLGAIRTDRPDYLYFINIVDQNECCLGLAYSSTKSLKWAVQE